MMGLLVKERLRDMNINFDTIKQQAQGRWQGIFAALGISIPTDKKHGPCPICGGKDRFRMDDKEGSGSWICNQCGAGYGIDLVQKALKVEVKEAFEAVAGVMGNAIRNPITEEKPVDPEIFRKLLKSSFHVKNNDPVHKYLQGRGLKTFPENTLYYAPKCWELETRQEQQAMLAIFRLPDGEAVTIHRTYLKDGKKLEIKSPKKIMPTLKKMSGGAVRLYEGKPETIAVCEGIETAIAIHELFGEIVWPCLSAPLLEAFEPPDWVFKVNIYTDNDSNYTGEKAAYVLANRLCIKNQLAVDVYHPKMKDFLDDLNMGIKTKAGTK